MGGRIIAAAVVVCVCQKGKKLSEGVAAWLRTGRCRGGNPGRRARSLAGAGLPLVPGLGPARCQRDRRNGLGHPRSRPKIDRIACPWLIRRFVDPARSFLFVAGQEVDGVADRFGATPFDVENVFWSHRGEECTFDTMVEGIRSRTSRHFNISPGSSGAPIPTGSTSCPKAAGLLAVSLGLSRMFADDLEQLEAGMMLYDAFYRWARDATQEKHEWVSHGAKKAKNHE